MFASGDGGSANACISGDAFVGGGDDLFWASPDVAGEGAWFRGRIVPESGAVAGRRR